MDKCQADRLKGVPSEYATLETFMKACSTTSRLACCAGVEIAFEGLHGYAEGRGGWCNGARSGDRVAFGALVERYKRRVCLQALGLVEVRFSTSYIISNASGILAFGYAVLIERVPPGGTEGR